MRIISSFSGFPSAVAEKCCNNFCQHTFTVNHFLWNAFSTLLCHGTFFTFCPPRLNWRHKVVFPLYQPSTSYWATNTRLNRKSSAKKREMELTYGSTKYIHAKVSTAKVQQLTKTRCFFSSKSSITEENFRG